MAVDFEEGDLVYTRDHSVKGRNKIQYFWDPTLYQVVRRPRPNGLVYTIVPVGQKGPFRQIHRTELRSIPESRTASNDVSEGILKVSGTIQETEENSELNAASGIEDDYTLNVSESDDEMSELPSAGQTPAKETGTSLVGEPWRSAQTTAGKHSNPHRLPRSVKELQNLHNKFLNFLGHIVGSTMHFVAEECSRWYHKVSL